MNHEYNIVNKLTELNSVPRIPIVLSNTTFFKLIVLSLLSDNSVIQDL